MCNDDRSGQAVGDCWQAESPLVLEHVRELDPEGRIVVHHRFVDTLGRMLKAGTITHVMVDAGRTFERQ